jgi:KaiC/GvpD/RAD55 family RecA-like ATPase
MVKKVRETLIPPFQTKRLPEELAAFLSRDTYSMMIKGDSGTGKTILALTILKILQPLENVLYISTRTSPLQLFEYYPWIQEIFPDSGKETQQEKTGGEESIVDSRLDEPNAVFERVTNVLMDKQAPTVVIDSWEALGDSLASDPLKTDLRVLETWRERAGARFIFIGEDPSNTTLDHLVEGVVVLGERVVSGRRLRELFLAKLHGTQIRKPSYFFTLDGGEFRSFPEFSLGDYAFRRPLPVELDHVIRAQKGRVPTGHDALDKALKGGISAHGTTLVGLGEGVDYSVGLVLFGKLVQGWSAANGHVLVQAPPNGNLGFLRQYVKAFGKAGRATILTDRVEAVHPERVLTILAGSGSKAEKPHAGGRSGPTIILSSEGVENSRQQVSAHLELTILDGTLFAHGGAPWTPLFGVVPESTGGNPSLRLEPVV